MIKPPLRLEINNNEKMAAAAAVADSKAAVPAVPPMPWFGMDIGGTLAKLVYFEPTDAEEQRRMHGKEDDQERAIVANIRHYLTKNKAYGESGHRDEHLQMDEVN